MLFLNNSPSIIPVSGFRGTQFLGFFLGFMDFCPKRLSGPHFFRRPSILGAFRPPAGGGSNEPPVCVLVGLLGPTGGQNEPQDPQTPQNHDLGRFWVTHYIRCGTVAGLPAGLLDN